MPESTETTPSLRDALKSAAKIDTLNPHKESNATNAAAVTPPEPEKKVEVAPVVAATKEAVKEVTTADPDEEIISGKRSPKSDDFKRVKTAAKKFQEEAESVKANLAQHEKELAELRKRPAANADEIAKVQKERDDLKQWRDTLALEFSPQFNEKYKNRIAAASVKLTGIFDPDMATKLTGLMTQPDSQWKREAMEKLTEDMTSYQISRLGAVDAELAGVLAERNSELARSQESIGKLVEEQQARKAQVSEQRTKTFTAFVEKQKTDNPFLKHREGDEAWNKGVDESLAIAKAVYDGNLDGDELADMALRGSYAHRTIAELRDARAENARLNDVLKKLQGASPDLEGRGGEGDSGGKEKSFRERMAEAANKR